MLANLVLATVMVVFTVIVHFVGLMLLLRLLKHSGRKIRPHESVGGQIVLVIGVVVALFAIHAIEIWAYAFVYLAIGALSDFETALYYSTTSFTTVGFGDVVLPREWRLVGAIEAANGFILFGWSIAFLLGMSTKFNALEHDWLERD